MNNAKDREWAVVQVQLLSTAVEYTEEEVGVEGVEYLLKALIRMIGDY